MEKKYKIGGKTFILDEHKAVQAYNEKQVINGRDTMTFNLLPLKYQWAYDLYRKMKSRYIGSQKMCPCKRSRTVEKQHTT